MTGSGKTEVYLRAIAERSAAGRGAIWLVPEIALTPVFARELQRQFGDQAALLHSAQSERERAEAWDRVRSGRARAVIGPRSAAFAPVADPGLFVVDEEHDGSYKQRESPRYDARDVAAIRARAAGAALVFGSATPSMEAYQASRDGRLRLLRLTARVDDRPLPRVTLVDLKREAARPEEKGVPLFSRALVERLTEVFSRGEQAILLQPRRGFAPFLLCRQCGTIFGAAGAASAADRPRPGPASRLPLLRGAGAAAAPLPRLRRRGARGDRRRHGARGRKVRGAFPRRLLRRSRPRHGAPARRGGGAGGSHLAAGAVPDRDADGRQGARLPGRHGGRRPLRGHAPELSRFPRRGEDLPARRAGRGPRRPRRRARDRPRPDLPSGAPRRSGARPRTTWTGSRPRSWRSAVPSSTRRSRSWRRSSSPPPDRDKAEAAAEALGKAFQESGDLLRISGPAPAPLERLQGRWRFQILIRAAERLAVLDALEAAVPERPPSGVQIAVDVDPQDLM